MADTETPVDIVNGPVADPANLRRVRFLPDAKVEGRKPGLVYAMDGSLADHYVSRGLAEILEADAPAVQQDRQVANSPRNRAMHGRKGE